MIHPGPLIESDGVDDERIAFPVADRVPHVGRVPVVARRMRPSVHEDFAPAARTTSGQDEDTLQLRLIDDLEAVPSVLN